MTIKFNPLTDIPDLSGRVAIVTGGNRGMGFHITQQLANHGAKVYLAARSESSAAAAIDRIETENSKLKGQNRIVFIRLNLSVLKEAKSAAEEFLKRESRLDLLVNNAAIMNHPYALTPDGLEDGFAVNHLGHFVFCKTLLSTLIATAGQPGSDVRVITVSSSIHPLAPAGGNWNTVDQINDPLAWNWSRDFIRGRYARYARSKLANILFAKQLQKKFDAAGVSAISTALDPGGVATETVIDDAGNIPIISHLLRYLLRKFARSPLQGAANALLYSTSVEVKKNERVYAGKFASDDWKVLSGSNDARSDTLAEQLWKISDDITEKILSNHSV